MNQDKDQGELYKVDPQAIRNATPSAGYLDQVCSVEVWISLGLVLSLSDSEKKPSSYNTNELNLCNTSRNILIKYMQI